MSVYFPLSGVDFNTRPEVDLEVENENENKHYQTYSFKETPLVLLRFQINCFHLNPNVIVLFDYAAKFLGYYYVRINENLIKIAFQTSKSVKNFSPAARCSKHQLLLT